MNDTSVTPTPPSSGILSLLPTDVILHILDHITSAELLPVSFTCSSLSRLSTDILADKRCIDQLPSLLFPCTAENVVMWWSNYIRPPCEEERVIIAETDNLPLLVRLHKKVTPDIRNIYLSALIKSGDVDGIEWAYHCDDEKKEIPEEQYPLLLDLSAFHGRLDVIQWVMNLSRDDLYEDLSNEVLSYAALGGQMQVILFMRRHGVPLSRQAFTSAIAGGHLHIMEFLFDSGVPLCETLTSQAAISGRLHLLQWLRQRGCPWDGTTAYQAALEGHIDVLKWCHASGCPIMSDSMVAGARSGSLQVIRFLHEVVGLTWHAELASCVNDLEALRELVGLGYAWNDRRCYSSAMCGVSNDDEDHHMMGPPEESYWRALTEKATPSIFHVRCHLRRKKKENEGKKIMIWILCDKHNWTHEEATARMQTASDKSDYLSLYLEGSTKAEKAKRQKTEEGDDPVAYVTWNCRKARQQQHTPGNMGANLSYEANDLSGKNVIVTGGNAGIGLVTARELAKLGASVTIACRDPTRAQNAVEELSKVGANVQTLPLDLASFESVQTFAKSYGEKHDALHILVLNAGIMALPERKTTKDGLEMQMGTNHFGHFLLTGLLMDRLKAAQGARVVTVASSAHQMASLDLDDLQSEKNYSKWKAYGNSKLANVLFAKELQKRSDANGWKIDAFSVHPGVIGTDLWNHNSGVQGAFLRFGRKFMRDTEEGAKTSLYCAVDRDAEKNKGGYFSDCAPKSGTSATRDDELAAGLWEKSEDICKVKYDA